ncbi:MAG: ABC transporter ATP-binding protein [Thermoanaerobaculia bacterium]
MNEGFVLQAEGLTKKIGDRTIVEDVSLAIRAGEIFGFLGPNGAGKTTTIRMLVGLIRPTEGNVRLGGHDLRREPEVALRKVGCIVESPDLYRFMTGRENLQHFARMIGSLEDEEIDRVSRIVGLHHRLDEKVKTYSLGMRQRLGIAQALMGSPQLLILDEPANGLDPAGIREMRALLRRLAHEEGLGILVSSHLLAEIELMCDRVAIIHRGRIISSGPVSELLARDVWTIETGEPARAADLLRQGGANIVESNGHFELGGSREAVAEAVQALVAAGIDVYGIEPRKRSLEDRFLDETRGESV